MSGTASRRPYWCRARAFHFAFNGTPYAVPRMEVKTSTFSWLLISALGFLILVTSTGPRSSRIPTNCFLGLALFLWGNPIIALDFADIFEAGHPAWWDAGLTIAAALLLSACLVGPTVRFIWSVREYIHRIAAVI